MKMVNSSYDFLGNIYFFYGTKVDHRPNRNQKFKKQTYTIIYIKVVLHSLLIYPK